MAHNTQCNFTLKYSKYSTIYLTNFYPKIFYLAHSHTTKIPFKGGVFSQCLSSRLHTLGSMYIHSYSCINIHYTYSHHTFYTRHTFSFYFSLFLSFLLLFSTLKAHFTHDFPTHKHTIHITHYKLLLQSILEALYLFILRHTVGCMPRGILKKTTLYANKKEVYRLLHL